LIAAALAGSLMALAPSHAEAQAFTLVCMPDPQFYTNSNHASLYNLYNRQATWIANNKTTQNIKHVIWLGDLTNDNTTGQWSTANSAYNILDNAAVSYAVVPGNHDYRTGNSDSWVGACLRNLTNFNNTVGPQRFSGKTWYGGNMGNTTDHNENNYTFFSAGGINFLVIGLEYAPRKETITWANNLIKQYPNHRVIIFTHMYLSTNGVYAGGSGSATGTVGAEGADLFEECASRHSNVFMVVCGHVTESKVNTKFGVAGNTVYEMLVDYQGEQVKGTGDDLGNGWLRLMKFDPATNKINGSTLTVASGDSAVFTNGTAQFYNGPYGASPTAADHLFSLNFNFAPPADPYTYLNDSLEFHDMTVNDTGGGDQQDEDIASADNGNWAAVWEDDHDANGVWQVYTRGFDSDGNVRFAESVVSGGTASCTNPSIAMAADGRYVVAWQSSNTAIKVRAYNANGTAAGAEQTVKSVAAPGVLNNPDVGIDDAGNFVVAWSDDADGNGSYQVHARGYAFNYTQRFAEKAINTIATGQQRNPVVGMAGNGDYSVAWEDDQDNDGKWEICLRGFTAAEAQKYAQLTVNSPVTGQQTDPDIAMDDTGRCVVVWEDDTDLNNSYQIKARGFGATGAQTIAEMTVNMNAGGNQVNPAVTADSFGNWYCVWQDDGITGGQGYQMNMNEFDAAGTRKFSADRLANSTIAVTHNFGSPARSNPAIAAHKSGRYIVAWADDMDGNGSYQILAHGLPGTARSLVTKAFNGTVTRSVNEPFYWPNASVALTATPAAGYSFVSWSGNVPVGSETANPLTITMDADKNITAKFAIAGPPAAPTGLTATTVSSSQINLAWTDAANNEANYVVARATSSAGPFTDIATLGANVTSYNNTGLAASTSYWYAVRATNASGSSANSNIASATTLSAIPTAPSGLTATAVSTSQINLAWTDNSTNETNFVVARGTAAGGPYTDVATLAANVTSYSNTGLAANTRYYYVVRATSAAGSSANSNEANALTWPADMIIDNNQAGFTASANWTLSTSAADKLGADYRFHNTAAVSDVAKWTFSVPQSRNYQIYAWWSQGTNRSTTAPYILPDATTVSKNQQTGGGAWQSLATKALTAGSNVVQLSCWTTTGFVVIADGVKLSAR
jgi:hypothetical protein